MEVLQAVLTWGGLSMLLVLVASRIRVIHPDEQGVLLRDGQVILIKQAGIIWLLPGRDRLMLVHRQEKPLALPAQSFRDGNTMITFGGVVSWFVHDPALLVTQALLPRYLIEQRAAAVLLQILSPLAEAPCSLAHGMVEQAMLRSLNEQTRPLGISIRSLQLWTLHQDRRGGSTQVFPIVWSEDGLDTASEQSAMPAQ